MMRVSYTETREEEKMGNFASRQPTPIARCYSELLSHTKKYKNNDICLSFFLSCLFFIILFLAYFFSTLFPSQCLATPTPFFLIPSPILFFLETREAFVPIIPGLLPSSAAAAAEVVAVHLHASNKILSRLVVFFIRASLAPFVCAASSSPARNMI